MAWIPSVVSSDKGEEIIWQNFETGETTNTPPSDWTGGDQNALAAYKAKAMRQLWDAAPGATVNDKINNFAAKFGGAAQVEQQLGGFGINPQDFYSSGAGSALLSARADSDFHDTVHQIAPLVIGGLMGGAALYGTPAAAAGTASGAGGATGVATGSALMPAAVPEAAGTLTSMGLVETAPGVWSAVNAPAAAAPIVSSFAPTSAATNPQTGALIAPAGGTTLTSAGATTGGLTGALSNPMVLGAGAGALLGGMGGGGKAGTIQTEEGIPDWLQPYVKPALDKYSAEVQNYNVDPYGIMPGAMQEFKNTVGGMYLDPSTNKYLEDYFRLGSERVKGSLSPTFGHMQAFGQHSGYNEALSRGLSDLAVGLYGGAYEKERDRQNQMIAAAPAFLGQNAQAQFQPYSQYLTSIGQLGRKKDEPYFTNPFGNILGGAMTGAAFGRAFA